jgi:hypothetical protein
MRIDAQPLGTNINIQISYSYDSYNIYLDGKLINTTVFVSEMTKDAMANSISEEVREIVLNDTYKKYENKKQTDR